MDRTTGGFPGAIEVGPDVDTGPSIRCLFWLCTHPDGDDIAQDFQNGSQTQK